MTQSKGSYCDGAIPTKLLLECGMLGYSVLTDIATAICCLSSTLLLMENGCLHDQPLEALQVYMALKTSGY